MPPQDLTPSSIKKPQQLSRFCQWVWVRVGLGGENSFLVQSCLRWICLWSLTLCACAAFGPSALTAVQLQKPGGKHGLQTVQSCIKYSYHCCNYRFLQTRLPARINPRAPKQLSTVPHRLFHQVTADASLATSWRRMAED